MKNREKQNWLVQTTGWAWRAVMVLILGILIICGSWSYLTKPEVPWSNLLCLIVGICGMALIAGLAWFIMKHTKNRTHRLIVIGCLSAVCAAGIFYSAGHYAFTPGWDPAEVYMTAMNLAYGLQDDFESAYFSRYPNNMLMTVFFSWIYRLAGNWKINEYFMLLGVLSAGFGLVLFLTYDCADRLLDGKRPDIALWCWIAALLLAGISPWVAVQYSDSLALILVTINVWLYLKVRDGRHRPLWILLLTFLTAISYRVKPQAAILLIAIVMMRVLGESGQWAGKNAWKKSCAAALAAVIGFGGGMWVGRQVISDCSPYLNSNQTFGPAQYLKMGLNEERMGVFAQEDVEVSASIANPEERNAYDLQVAADRVREMGAGRLLKHGVRKLLINYGDGTFAWEQEGMFYDFDSYYFTLGSDWGYEHIPPFYIDGKYEEMVEYSCSYVWRTIVQCVWMCVLALGIFSFRRKGDTRIGTLQLAILGLTLFELLFEARARYLFAYAPVYILLAGAGIRNLTDAVQGIRKRKAA